MPTIHKAESIFYQWLVDNMPEVTSVYNQEELRLKRIALRDRSPDLSHDMSKLRVHSLIELADQFGFSHQGGVDDWIAEAFDTFYQARQLVNPYDDVVPVLKSLRQHFVLATATNGNADITQTTLSGFFEHSVSAAEAGISKPHPAMFELLQQKTDFDAEQILHIGDHPHDDIQGAGSAGIRSIWLNRQQQAWPGGEYSPDFTISDLYQLRALLAAKNDQILVE